MIKKSLSYLILILMLALFSLDCFFPLVFYFYFTFSERTSYLLIFKNNFKSLFIFGCAGCFLLCRLFSSYKEWGLLSNCSAQASHCSGFSCCWAWVLGHAGMQSRVACDSRLVAHKLDSTGSIRCRRAWLLCDMWNLPGSGVKSMSPTLAGRFFTTEPPEKPLLPWLKFLLKAGHTHTGR